MTAGFLFWAIVATVLVVVLAVSLHETKAEVARWKRWTHNARAERDTARTERVAWNARALEAEKECGEEEKRADLLEDDIAALRLRAAVARKQLRGLLVLAERPLPPAGPKEAGGLEGE